MDCLNCEKHEICAEKAKTDEDLAHKMWMYEFWGNAQDLCRRFALVINRRDTSDEKD